MKPCPYCKIPVEDNHSICDFCGMPLPDPKLAHLPKGTRLASGRYSIGGLLGRGGFGLTYHGSDTILKRPVAIKELFPKGSTRRVTSLVPPETLGLDAYLEAKQLFLEEASVLAKFNHPAIVRVWDVFEDNGTAYLVMEYLSGHTLLGHLAQYGTLSSSEVLGLMEPLLAGLEEMHGAGLLHRDIKPDNVFLTDDGRTMLIDFGAARGYALNQQKVENRVTLTHGYAPPEQYTARTDFGPSTDLYALGATLYQCLTGQKPPNATDRQKGTVLPTLPANIPHSLQNTLTLTLALDSRERPQNVREVHELLSGSSQASVRLGPHDDLHLAIKQLPEGTVVTLEAGEYRLPRRLEIKKSISLHGAGIGQTRIIGADRYFVVQINSAGYFNAQGISFEHIGDEQAHVLTVSAGEVFIQNCRFEGGTRSLEWRGTGLYLYKNAKGGMISDNVFCHNAIGIALQSEARPMVQGNHIHDNLSEGIAYFDFAGGTARLNRLERNRNGIVVGGEAQPTIEENTLSLQTGSGLVYSGNAAGVAKENTIEKSSEHGVWVGADAFPKLEKNLIRRNRLDGLAYEANTLGNARANIIEKNGGMGISVSGHAKPTLERNILRENAQIGLYYSESAGGTASKNTCEFNQGDGVVVCGQAIPNLEENILRENEGRGLVYLDQSGGIARFNMSSHNRGFGIYITQEANPQLEGHTLRRLEESEV